MQKRWVKAWLGFKGCSHLRLALAYDNNASALALAFNNNPGAPAQRSEHGWDSEASHLCLALAYDNNPCSSTCLACTNVPWMQCNQWSLMGLRLDNMLM
eukprot:scaffold70034_cov20-Tisochrysis_lutea.AAC.1